MPTNPRLWIAFVALALLPAMLTAYVLWLAPIADLAADHTAVAARDFTALWGAGRLSLEGTTAALADPALFTGHLRAWFGPGIPDQIWPYPPPMLLLAAPLALLPLGWSFLLYTAATLALLFLVLRSADLPPALRLVALFSPAVAENALFGQNGTLTAALLVGGLLLIDRRPLLAGLLLGALIVKPQMGLLLPVALVAGRRWQTARTGVITATLLAGVVTLWFGTGPWSEYFVAGRPAITAYLESPWDPGSAQSSFASAFIAARSLGAGLTTAYAVQAGVTLLCAVLAYRAWRRPDWTPERRVALTVALACAASPWVHCYDLPALAAAIVILLHASRPEQLPLLALAWCGPSVLAMLKLPHDFLILGPLLVVWVACRPLRRPAVAPRWKPFRCAPSA